jgi:hypothetical protein
MSLTRKIKAKRLRKDPRTAPARPSPDAPAARRGIPRRWLVWLMTLACLLGGALSTYYLIEFVLWPRIPAELVGQWQAKDGRQAGVVLEFWPNGAFQARVNFAGKAGGVNARAEFDDADAKLLHIISVNPQTGKEEAKTHIIRSLTETELVMEDATGEVTRFVRLE